MIVAIFLPLLIIGWFWVNARKRKAWKEKQRKLAQLDDPNVIEHAPKRKSSND
ncbi:hypothetical protein [Ponticaulis sp.]|uniref:hypothetical protein n=1 Tax=Ponticaulis sp. TaxID=2020902 RepID=UPI0025D93320|nr:hypothetical protein [Ponticaulis sp.]|tara:strand:- start:70713 stop:70871 length:159 start_codon:yes stop_codon:yes gene_type:complete